MQPYLCGRRLDVAGIIWKLVVTSFDLFVEVFDSIPIPMCFMLESKPMTTQGRLKPGCAIDEEHGVGDVMFLLQITKKEE